jgi:hypothetical protein
MTRPLLLFAAMPLAVLATDLKPGGPPAELKAAAGGEATMQFEAKAGQSLIVGIDKLAYTPDAKTNGVLAVTKADGTRVAVTTCRTQALPDDMGSPPPCKVALFDIAEAGRHTVTFTPASGSSASGRVLLVEASGGPVELGKPVKLAGLKPAQPARYTFEGTAGQKVSVRVSDIVTSPKGAPVTVFLQQIEGGRFNSTMSNTGKNINMPVATLRGNGKYAVTVDPGVAAIESAELSVKEFK